MWLLFGVISVGIWMIWIRLLFLYWLWSFEYVFELMCYYGWFVVGGIDDCFGNQFGVDVGGGVGFYGFVGCFVFV